MDHWGGPNLIVETLAVAAAVGQVLEGLKLLGLCSTLGPETLLQAAETLDQQVQVDEHCSCRGRALLSQLDQLASTPGFLPSHVPLRVCPPFCRFLACTAKVRGRGPLVLPREEAHGRGGLRATFLHDRIDCCLWMCVPLLAGSFQGVRNDSGSVFAAAAINMWMGIPLFCWAGV